MKHLLETIRLAALDGFSCSFQIWQHRHDAEPHVSSFSVHWNGQMIAHQYRSMTAKEAARLIARLTDFAC
jgi:hypothetical protein